MKLKEQLLLKDFEIENLIGKNSYDEAAEYLFNSQLNNWLLLKNNYEAVRTIQTKSFWFEGFKIKVQLNPQRIKSTSAEVDEVSVLTRRCFLCAENLPVEQKGILLDENFLLLCNPFPVFPQHFTIVSITHQPQQIAESFSEFLNISRLLSRKYTLIYNGPACGASAPDHLHFQAGTKNIMPIENDIQQLKNDFGKIFQNNGNITTSFIDDGLRKLIFVESTDKFKIIEAFELIYNIYENMTGVKPEPLMNLLCNYDPEFGWSVIIFLRSKHRPEIFFKEDPDKTLISPAAIDLGGLVVTPREEDFIRMEKELLEKIFCEVSLDKKTFSLLVEKIKTELS